MLYAKTEIEKLGYEVTAKAERLAAEQKMEVVKVNQIKQAEIDKEKAIIVSEQEKKTGRN